MADTAEKSGYGILTEEGIARLRQRIGIQVRKPTAPHNYEVTFDGTRHFANGYGDNNPLWADREYGKSTRWGGLIAPPNFLYTMGEHDAPELTPEQKALMKGDPLVGLGSYQAEMSFEWWRPLRLGDQLKQRSALVGVSVNDHSSFGGRTVTETNGYIYRNQKNELTAIQRGSWIRVERHASKERKKEYELPKPYTPEQLAEIDATYEAETLRGATPLYWEDVQVGEDLPTMVRGPLRTSDIVVWHVGWGMQLTPPGAFRESWKIRKKVPGMYTPNGLNIPDTVQRLHWETAWANELGVPIPYDYGGLRETFLTNICTNWMGDEGWLWKLTCQHRKFVYTGDTYWIKGKVTDKKQEAGRNEVHLNMWVENQWGTIVSPGSAVVLLPTRDKAVELPRPAQEDVDQMFAHEVETM
ncbi:MAG: MaoC family dehydratase N-terminal domain-containing protein, partial [Caulobacteraceae bacterium]|nr:MaoC family dehydratase N-terminal domain-containing protein [Caulobacteraceae bacterium]